MTFKDLQKLVGSQAGPEQTQILQRLGDKEFWYWDQTKHKEKDIRTKGGCCFKHIVGLPRKTEEKSHCLITKSYCIEHLYSEHT